MVAFIRKNATLLLFVYVMPKLSTLATISHIALMPNKSQTKQEVSYCEDSLIKHKRVALICLTFESHTILHAVEFSIVTKILSIK